MDVFVSGGKVDYSCRSFRGEAAFGQVVQHSGNGFEVTVDFLKLSEGGGADFFFSESYNANAQIITARAESVHTIVKIIKMIIINPPVWIVLLTF